MFKRRPSVETSSIAALAALFLCGSAYFAYSWFTVDTGFEIHRLSDEPSRLASTMFFDKLTSISQLTLALLGATWAMVAVQDTKVTLANRPTRIAFGLTNASFVLSLLVYSRGYDFIIQRIFHHQAFDIDAPFVCLVNTGQQSFFIFGCIALVCTILLGRRTT
jgi:hypothetical protein